MPFERMQIPEADIHCRPTSRPSQRRLALAQSLTITSELLSLRLQWEPQSFRSNCSLYSHQPLRLQMLLSISRSEFSSDYSRDDGFRPRHASITPFAVAYRDDGSLS